MEEISKPFQQGSTVYFVYIMIEDGQRIDITKLQIKEGVVKNISNDGKMVDVSFEFNGQQFKKTYSIQHVFNNSVLAERRKHEMQYDILKKRIIDGLAKDILPSKEIKPHFLPILSGNLLRNGEKNVVFGIQTNVFDGKKKANPQKIIALLAVCLDDIEILISLLEMALFMNDYTKKLIGKYLILEFINIFNLLKMLAKIEPKCKPDFISCENEIKILENKYGFSSLRDLLIGHKIASQSFEKYILMWKHVNKASIDEYWKVITKHVDKILTKFFPMEKRIYFLIRNKEMKGAPIMMADSKDYVAFDDYQI